MSKILIANNLDSNSLNATQTGLEWSDKLNLEPLILHGDKLADYETLDSVFAHLNLGSSSKLCQKYSRGQ